MLVHNKFFFLSVCCSEPVLIRLYFSILRLLTDLKNHWLMLVWNWWITVAKNLCLNGIKIVRCIVNEMYNMMFCVLCEWLFHCGYCFWLKQMWHSIVLRQCWGKYLPQSLNESGSSAPRHSAKPKEITTTKTASKKNTSATVE